MLLEQAYKILEECGIKRRELEVGEGLQKVGLLEGNRYIARQMSNMDFEAREFGFYYGENEGKDGSDYKFYVRLVLFSPVSKQGFLEYVRVYRGRVKRVTGGKTYLVQGNWGYPGHPEGEGVEEFNPEKGVEIEKNKAKRVLVVLGLMGHIYSSMIVVGKTK